MLALTSMVHGILPPFGSMDRHETANVLSFFAALSGATLVKWARRSHLAESQRMPPRQDPPSPGCPLARMFPRQDAPSPGCPLARMPPRQDAQPAQNENDACRN
ncbi:unnamed protein product [Polarella glacialis]|uniref:Uncharacterized protein n=1 Tax=Polarella glacialis TaxID=89957 RepID=A0A813GXS8_POLGL|nr:unnamed protein product [Polarella glacialis]